MAVTPHVFNVIFAIFSGIFLSLGVWLQTETNDFETDSPVPSVSGAQSVWDAAVGMSIFTGAFGLLTALIGGRAMYRIDPRLGKTYMTFVSITFAAQFTTAVLASVTDGQVDNNMRLTMVSNLQNAYNNPNMTVKPDSSATDSDKVSYSWNLMQSKWRCCGANDYSDYANTDWAKKSDLNVPYECCVRKVDISDSNMDIENIKNYTACQEEAQNKCSGLQCLYIYNQGCYNVINSWTNDYAPVIIGTGFAFLFLEIISYVSAWILVQEFREAIYRV